MKNKKRIVLAVLALCVALASCAVLTAVALQQSGEQQGASPEPPLSVGALLSGGSLSAVTEDGIEVIDSAKVAQLRAAVEEGRPLLTRELAEQLAEQAEALCGQEADVILPGYGDAETAVLARTLLSETASVQERIDAYCESKRQIQQILSYQLCLLTPSAYRFTAEELYGDDLDLMNFIGPRYSLYLALAGTYETREEALAAMQSGQAGYLQISGYYGFEEEGRYTVGWGSVSYHQAGDVIALTESAVAVPHDVVSLEEMIAAGIQVIQDPEIDAWVEAQQNALQEAAE